MFWKRMNRNDDFNVKEYELRAALSSLLKGSERMSDAIAGVMQSNTSSNQEAYTKAFKEWCDSMTLARITLERSK